MRKQGLRKKRWNDSDRKPKISMKKKMEKRRSIDLYVDEELDSWEAKYAYQNRR